MTDEWPTLPPAGGPATHKRTGSFSADYWAGDANALKAIVAELEAAMEKAYLAFRSGRPASSATRWDIEAYTLRVSVFADGATWDGPLDETFGKVDPTKTTSMVVNNRWGLPDTDHPHVTLKMELAPSYGSKTVSLHVSGSDVQWIEGLVAAVRGLVEKGKPRWVRWKPVERSRSILMAAVAGVVSASALAVGAAWWAALPFGVVIGLITPGATGLYGRYDRMFFWFPKFEVTKTDGRSQGDRSLAALQKIGAGLVGAISLGLAIWGTFVQGH